MTATGPAGRAARPEPAVATLPDPREYSVTATRLTGTDAAFDPLALAADDGHLVAGRSLTVAGQGVAAVLALPDGVEDPAALREVVAWLGAIVHGAPPPAPRSTCAVAGTGERDGPGGRALPAPGAVAVGAFPFDRGAPAFLIVPSVAWCRGADGRAWRVAVSGPHDDKLAPRGVARATGTPPARLPGGRIGDRLGGSAASPTGAPSVVEQPEGVDYAAAVAEALTHIAAGRFSKVVLSRAVHMVFSEAPSPSQVLGALWDGDPAFSPFSVPVTGGRLVGASPELIVSRIGATVTSHPFAGTIPLDSLGDDDSARRLFTSTKDRQEHRLLVDEIGRALAPYCAELDVPAAPSVVPLRSDARLGSWIHGTLRRLERAHDAAHDAAHGAAHRAAPRAAGDAAAGAATALDLLAVLHPTPAVGGVPRAAALDAIASLEPVPRGYWAGVTGWVDGNGDGEWVLAIRAALLDRHRALVRAGAGIVEGSDPTTELAETTVKLSPVLDALSPGTSSRLL